MPLPSRIYDADQGCFYLQKMAGFEALNFRLLLAGFNRIAATDGRLP